MRGAWGYHLLLPHMPQLRQPFESFSTHTSHSQSNGWPKVWGLERRHRRRPAAWDLESRLFLTWVLACLLVLASSLSFASLFVCWVLSVVVLWLLCGCLRRFGRVLVASAALNSDGFRFRCPLTVHLGAGSLVQGWLSSCDTVHLFLPIDVYG